MSMPIEKVVEILNKHQHGHGTGCGHYVAKRNCVAFVDRESGELLAGYSLPKAVKIASKLANLATAAPQPKHGD